MDRDAACNGVPQFADAAGSTEIFLRCVREDQGEKFVGREDCGAGWNDVVRVVTGRSRGSLNFGRVLLLILRLLDLQQIVETHLPVHV